MGLLIVTFVNGVFVEQVACDFHRTHDSLNERDFAGGKAILLVEVTVRPRPRPLLGRNEGVNLAICVLRWLVQKNEEAGQPTAEVGQDTLGFSFRLERPDVVVRPRRDASWLSDKWCAEDPMGVGVSIAGTRSSRADENFPLVEDGSFLLNFRSCDVPYPTVPVDL